LPAHLHSACHLNKGDVVVVTLDRQANVMLLDDSNYSSYKTGRNFHFYGGHAEVSPINITAPSTGHWHVAIDLGGGSGTIHPSIHIIKQ